MNEKAGNRREIVFNERFEARFRVLDSSQMVDVAGRCMRCWGSITGRFRDSRLIRIECRVCRLGIDAEEAKKEFERMGREMNGNLSQVCRGRGAVYDGNARFVLKIFPEMGSNREVFEERTGSVGQKKGRRLTRRKFNKKGTPGFLYFQASTLVSGLGALPYDMSLISMSDIDLENLAVEAGDPRADKSGRMCYSAQVSSKVPSSDQVQERMGSAMMALFTAALACEIMMKAILLTRIDEAEMIHDLKKLYNVLPKDCRERLKADLAEIAEILTKHRHSFGNWRYFEPHLGEGVDQKVIEAIIDPNRVWGLSKAARVLVDEGLISGLQHDFHLNYNVDFQTSVRVSEKGEVTSTLDGSQVRARLEIGGHETAIDWETITRQ